MVWLSQPLHYLYGYRLMPPIPFKTFILLAASLKPRAWSWLAAGGWLVAVRWSKLDEFLEFLTSKRLKPRILRCVVVQNLVFYEVFEGSICTTVEPFGQKSMEKAFRAAVSVTPRPPMRAHPPRTSPNLSCCKLETSSLELVGCWWLAGG